jgi:hypothetical protein
LQTSGRDKSWSAEEDEELIQLHERMGNHWSRIASVMNGRTDNQVKNRWYSTVSRRMQRTWRGEDPDFKRGPKKREKKKEEEGDREEGEREIEREVKIEELSPVFGGGCDELFERDFRMDESDSTTGPDGFGTMSSSAGYSLFDSQLPF